ncbi:multicopper oxidase domain-containing protein [Bacillus canaveralius]|uniref:multicopper oxidase domain-containing protein n=1 Tax=Bacillus canaveralius TaxID=1403243 RepID=UPI00268DD51D
MKIKLQFSNNQKFYQIASDGGLLEKPVEMTKVVLSPAERAEIIVDFSDFKKGDAVQLDRDGKPPPANETGWKDTILVNPGEKVRAIATFDQAGVFMYHCHILEHEDAGMMGQFQVK